MRRIHLKSYFTAADFRDSVGGVAVSLGEGPA